MRTAVANFAAIGWVDRQMARCRKDVQIKIK